MNSRSTSVDAAGQGAAVLEPPRSRPPAIGSMADAEPRPISAPRRGPPRRLLLVLVLAAAGGYAWYAGLIDVRKLRDRLLCAWNRIPLRSRFTATSMSAR